MRHILSTHLFVQHRLTVALLDRIQRSGIREIELFCARQHLDYHNPSQIAELKHWFDDSELKVHSMHSPMFSDDIWGRSGPQSVLSLTEISKIKRIVVTDEIKRAVEIADTVPFRYLIQHIGVPDEEYELSKIDAAFNCLDEIVVFAKQLDVEVLLENIPNEFSSAQRLRSFLDTTHLPLHFSFDTGHAHLNGGVEKEFLLMKDLIRSTHVHDNDGESDSHLFPLPDGPTQGGEGAIDWTETMRLLRSIGQQAPLLLELREDPEMENPLDEVRRTFDRLESC